MQPSIQVTGTSARDNNVSTRDTIVLMKQLVKESLNDPYIAGVASTICSGLCSSSVKEDDVINACYWWVKNHLILREDEDSLVALGIPEHKEGSELLMSPAYTVRFPSGTIYGDCDDFSTLLATLLVKCGLRKSQVFFCTVAADMRIPNAFSHVYVAVVIGDGSILGLDCSHGPYPGWEEQNVSRKLYWNV